MTKNSSLAPKPPLRIGLVVPHLFMQRDILPEVIFSPGQLALDLSAGLTKLGVKVTLFTPGAVDTSAVNVNADLSLFQAELDRRGYGYLELLKKYPLLFVTLARQAQTELLTSAFTMANNDELDVLHVYTNEEELGLIMAPLCQKPMVFTHHDPFNYLVRYRSIMPRYKQANWLSISDVQRRGMPADTNWLATIYHGLNPQRFQPVNQPTNDYIAYYGRIIEAKGVHLAIAAVRQYNQQNPNQKLKLKLAGKHYAGSKDGYWQTKIQPELGDDIEYVGFLNSDQARQNFLGNARALLVPSLFPEPFGMVMIEAFACGTPVIGTAIGAIPEVINEAKTGYVIPVQSHQQNNKVIYDEAAIASNLAAALTKIGSLDHRAIRQEFEARFTLQQMCQQHLQAYQKLLNNH